MTEATAALEAMRWDLDPLLEGGAGEADPEQAVTALLDRAEALGAEFAEAHREQVAELDGPGLVAAMRTLAEISDLVGRAGSYAHLRFAADTEDPANGALVAMLSERGARINTELLFFDLEWNEIPDERAGELLATEGLEFCRHHMRMERRYLPHQLSTAEERLASELSVTGAGAWSRLFDELTSAIRVQLPKGPGGGDGANGGAVNGGGDSDGVPLDVALANLASPDRELRRATAESVTAALQPGIRTRAYVFNTLLQDKAIKDRLRSYPHWLAARNLSNEASDESVQALIEAVKGRYGLAREWYSTKARLLGIERLADYDRMASVATDETEIGWPEAREIVANSFASFSPTAAEVAERFFEEGWIDAPPDPSKRGGAFSASTVPSVHPYVMLNYTGRRRDVMTLAHELGHGLHQTLAREQGIFHQNTPLTVAETASVFAEEITFGRLLAQATEPADRLALLAEAVEGQIATVFRQVAMNQFEHAVHTARREEGELAVERFGELWADTQEDLLGDSVEVTGNYRSWWSYVPHFIGSPGYVYAYAYGQLLALSVYRLYTERGEEMVPAYIEMLTAGGSRSPEELGRIVGVDLTDPGFWDSGLELVAEQVEQATEAAEAVIADRSQP